MHLNCEKEGILPFDLLHLVNGVWERDIRALWEKQGDDSCHDGQTSHKDVRKVAIISTCGKAEDTGYSETGFILTLYFIGALYRTHITVGLNVSQSLVC